MKRAPEPSDINWENLYQNPFAKWMRRVFSDMISGLIIWVSFIIITIISFWQDYYIKSRQDHGNPMSNMEVQAFNLAISLVIASTDPLLCYIITALAKRERHSTKTNYLSSAAIGTYVSKFINNVFTLMIAKAILIGRISFENNTITIIKNFDHTDLIQIGQFYSDGGVIQNMFLVIAMNAFSEPLCLIFDPVNIIKKLRICFTNCRGRNNKLTQGEAHELFEGIDFDIEERHGYLLSTTIMTAFFAPIIPAGIVFTLVGLAFNYWINKIIFLRRISLPPSLADRIQVEMTHRLKWKIGRAHV